MRKEKNNGGNGCGEGRKLQCVPAPAFPRNACQQWIIPHTINVAGENENVVWICGSGSSRFQLDGAASNLPPPLLIPPYRNYWMI